MKSTFLITVEHAKPIDDLCDKVAARAWTIDGVSVSAGNSAVTARALDQRELDQVEQALDAADAEKDMRARRAAAAARVVVDGDAALA